MLRSLTDEREGRISIEEIVHHFGRRAFGAVLFIFAAPNMLPLPPGSSTVLAFPLLIIAPQLAFGAHRLWLPGFLTRRAIDRRLMARSANRLAAWVERAEHLTAPRLPLMVSHAGDMAIGAVVTLLSAVLILPIPLGNLLPAMAIAALSLSLIQRDGVLTLIGHALALTSFAVLALGAGVIWSAFARLGAVFGA